MTFATLGLIEPLRGLWEKAREARPAVPHESVMQVMRVAWASKTFVRTQPWPAG